MENAHTVPWDCFEIYASGTGLKKTAEEMPNNKNITTYDVINELNKTITNTLKNVNPGKTIL